MLLRRLSFWDRLLLLIPARRKRYRQRIQAGMRYLAAHPDEPVHYQGD